MDQKPLAASAIPGENIVGADSNGIKGQIWGYEKIYLCCENRWIGSHRLKKLTHRRGRHPSVFNDHICILGEYNKGNT